MRKAYYSIGFFLACIFLSVGYYVNYQAVQLQAQIEELEQIVKAMPVQQINAIPTREDTQEHTQEHTQKHSIDYEERKSYLIKEKNGYLIVYLADGETLYEETTIVYAYLPQELKMEVQKGKVIQTTEELYGFLESHTS